MSATAAEATVRISTFGPDPDAVALDFDLDDTPYRVIVEQPDGMTAATWAARDDFLALFPGALDADQRGYWTDRMRDPSDPLTVGALRAVTYSLAPLLYAVDWWAAHRLCARAAANWWQYEAWTVGKGFDPRTAPAARIVASCWAWAASGCEKDEDVEALHREIFARPAGLPPTGDEHLAKLARGRAMLARHLPGQAG